MSLKTQAKVLRVLEEQVVESVGGRIGVELDVRVVAATNKSLPDEIQAGRFRDDLFYRLNVVPISVPPLRERKEDIGPLTEHFLASYASEYGHRAKSVEPEARALLQDYRWPGNVRELRNVIERVVIMVPGPVVTASDIAFLAATPVRPDLPPGQPQRPARLQDARDQFERDFIVQVLTEQGGNITRTAEALGMERSNLHRKMRSFGIRSQR